MRLVSIEYRPANAGIAQLVERYLAKVQVGSSSLLSRSKFKNLGNSGVFLCCFRRIIYSNKIWRGSRKAMQVIANHSNVGSNPILASTCSPGGEIGRRKGLKIPRWQHRAGSIPALGTIFKINSLQRFPHVRLLKYFIAKNQRVDVV